MNEVEEAKERAWNILLDDTGEWNREEKSQARAFIERHSPSANQQVDIINQYMLSNIQAGRLRWEEKQKRWWALGITILPKRPPQNDELTIRENGMNDKKR